MIATSGLAMLQALATNFEAIIAGGDLLQDSVKNWFADNRQAGADAHWDHARTAN